MGENDLLATALHIRPPWSIVKATWLCVQGVLRLEVECSREVVLPCAVCGGPTIRYDSRSQRWRHVDLGFYPTMISGKVPRVGCHLHGIRMVRVPWAGAVPGFTAGFEAAVTRWLEAAPLATVAERMALRWEEAIKIAELARERVLRRPQRLEAGAHTQATPPSDEEEPPAPLCAPPGLWLVPK